MWRAHWQHGGIDPHAGQSFFTQEGYTHPACHWLEVGMPASMLNCPQFKQKQTLPSIGNDDEKITVTTENALFETLGLTIKSGFLPLATLMILSSSRLRLAVLTDRENFIPSLKHEDSGVSSGDDDSPDIGAGQQHVPAWGNGAMVAMAPPPRRLMF